MKPEQPLHALLIGIDHYPDGGCLADGGWYPDLHGSVRDIERMAAFLRRDLEVPEDRMRCLTAPLPSSSPGAVPEPVDERPTYGNMVAAFHDLLHRARAGEQVLIHYSGHGGRTPTLAPETKPGGFDESLVPTDIADPASRYLRDLDIAWLLGKMVAKGLYVTLLLDCCHAGGATRLVNQPRGGSAIDRTPRPPGSLVAPTAELIATWQRQQAKVSRDVSVGSGWLPDPRGYVLLAACRATELAYECDVEGFGRVGAFSHWLLEGLRTMAAGGTFRQLHQRITAQVRGRLEMQTPQIEGDIDRRIFGREHARPPRHAVNVLRSDGDRLLLNTGEAHGVRAGARFAIYPPPESGELAEEKLADAEITHTGAVDSWARVEAGGMPAPIPIGAQAVPLPHHQAQTLGPVDLRELGNDDALSPLAGQLWVALARLPATYHPAQPPRPVPGASFETRLEVVVGEWLCLKIENLARQPFNVTVLDLRPAGDVAQIFPLASGGAFHVLDPGLDLLLPLRADLPTRLDRGVDMLKVFATLDATDFRWLETSTSSPTRGLEPSAYPSRDWTAEQVEVSVTRPPLAETERRTVDS